MVSKMVLAVASLAVLLHAAAAMNHANCPYNTACGCHSFCCNDADCQNLLGSNMFMCTANYQCAKCGSDPSTPCPDTTPSMTPTMAPSKAPSSAPTYSTSTPVSTPTVTRPPTYAPASTPGSYSASTCNIKPVAGFCCSDADCHAQTGQKFVYCNTKYNQCNACGLYKTPKCPGGQTPVDGACPYQGFNNDGMFCCTDNDCKTALNQTYVYCNKDYFQCNACGLPGTPACPSSSSAPTYGGYGGSAGSQTGRGGYGGYGYGYGYAACSEGVQQCCSDLTCQKRINNPYVFCNTTYFQCNACGNMANQACCPGNICRSGFTCTNGVCIQTGYVPPAGAVVGIVLGVVAVAAAAVAGVAVMMRRRRNYSAHEDAPVSSELSTSSLM